MFESSRDMLLCVICDIVYSQVDLQEQQEVKCVATQGRETNQQWLTNYQIAYSSEGNDWKFYEQSNGEVKVIYCRFSTSAYKGLGRS